MSTRDIAELHANTRNPRQVSKKKLKMLKDAVKEFGDLGGVVFNLTTNQLVGGHQRVEAYKDCGSKQLVIERAYDEPTPAGTVREGYFLIAGERHAYREVQWSEDKENAANLAANKQAGEWSLPDLKSLLGDLRASDFDTDLSMFDAGEIDSLLGELKEEPEPKDAEIEPKLLILITCVDEQQQTELLEQLQADGVTCKPMMT